MAKENNKRKQTRFEMVGDLVSIFCRGNRWYANCQIDGKQIRKSLKTTSKKEAERRALRLEDEVKSGQHQLNARLPSIDAVIEAYRRHLTTEGRAKKTLIKYEK